MVEQEQTIIKEFIDLVKDRFSMDINENNTYNKVRIALTKISNNRLPIMRLQAQVDKKKEEYEDISKPYVRGECYGGDGGGSPINSFKKAYDENIHYLRLEMEQEISDLQIEKRILEKQLEEELRIFDDLLLLIEHKAQAVRQVMVSNYIDKQCYADIALTMNLSYGTVRQYVVQGIKDISQKIQLFTKVHKIT